MPRELYVFLETMPSDKKVILKAWMATHKDRVIVTEMWEAIDPKFIPIGF